jgi:Tfp pilus assembly protein PilV
MNIKRILFLSVGIVGILAVVLGAVAFTLTARSSAQAAEALSNPSAEQPAVQSDPRFEAYYAETKSSSSSAFHDYSSDGYGCSHDSYTEAQWSNED